MSGVPSRRNSDCACGMAGEMPAWMLICPAPRFTGLWEFPSVQLAGDAAAVTQKQRRAAINDYLAGSLEVCKASCAESAGLMCRLRGHTLWDCIKQNVPLGVVGVHQPPSADRTSKLSLCSVHAAVPRQDGVAERGGPREPHLQPHPDDAPCGGHDRPGDDSLASMEGNSAMHSSADRLQD